MQVFYSISTAISIIVIGNETLPASPCQRLAFGARPKIDGFCRVYDPFAALTLDAASLGRHAKAVIQKLQDTLVETLCSLIHALQLGIGE